MHLGWGITVRSHSLRRLAECKIAISRCARGGMEYGCACPCGQGSRQAFIFAWAAEAEVHVRLGRAHATALTESFVIRLEGCVGDNRGACAENKGRGRERERAKAVPGVGGSCCISRSLVVWRYESSVSAMETADRDAPVWKGEIRNDPDTLFGRSPRSELSKPKTCALTAFSLWQAAASFHNLETIRSGCNPLSHETSCSHNHHLLSTTSTYLITLQFKYLKLPRKSFALLTSLITAPALPVTATHIAIAHH